MFSVTDNIKLRLTQAERLLNINKAILQEIDFHQKQVAHSMSSIKENQEKINSLLQEVTVLEKELT